jgi:hypothetical protein
MSPNYRLSNNQYPRTSASGPLNLVNISEQEILAVFALPAPYEIKDGVRYYAGTTKWVSEKNKIIVIDKLGNKLYFNDRM